MSRGLSLIFAVTLALSGWALLIPALTPALRALLRALGQ